MRARSATNDGRFKALQSKDLPSLECGVSVLHSFEQCATLDDWDVGTHGVTLQFTINKVSCAVCDVACRCGVWLAYDGGV